MLQSVYDLPNHPGFSAQSLPGPVLNLGRLHQPGRYVFGPAIHSPLADSIFRPYSSRPPPPVNTKTTVIGTLLIIVVGSLISYEIWGKNSSSASSLDELMGISPSPVVLSLVTTAKPPTSTPYPTITIKPTLSVTATPFSSPKPTAEAATPTTTPTTLTQYSTASLDGFRSSNNGGNDSLEIRIGRNTNLTMRGFVSFDIPATISGKIIDSVSLRLYQYQVTGSPYSVGGNLQAEHVDYGSTLGDEDYSAAVFDSHTATVGASNPTLEWKDFIVTPAFKNDLQNGHSRSQYRLKFTTETVGGSDTGDFAYFYSSNSGANTFPPQLLIRFF